MPNQISEKDYMDGVGKGAYIDPTPGIRNSALSMPVANAGGIIRVGTPPNGFGTVVQWDRADKEILLVAFVNAADDFGVAVAGLRAGDEVKVMSMAGTATFSDSVGKILRGIIAIAAKAGQAYAIAEGVPEAASVIQAGADYATREYLGKPGGKKRDAYGYDGATLARNEGGVLVCMPEAGGPYYATEGLRGETNGVRSDDRLPNYMKSKDGPTLGGFFPVRPENDPVPPNRPQNTRIAQKDGVLHLIAWDKKFDDNAGYYQVILRITRGD